MAMYLMEVYEGVTFINVDGYLYSWVQFLHSPYENDNNDGTFLSKIILTSSNLDR